MELVITLCITEADPRRPCGIRYKFMKGTTNYKLNSTAVKYADGNLTANYEDMMQVLIDHYLLPPPETDT